MTNMLKGLGTFDAKTGVGRVSGMNMDFARNIAKAMGISADEAVTIAKKQAEARFKESKFGNTSLARFQGDEEKRNYILNNSTYNTSSGKLELNGKDVDKLSPEDIANMMQFDNKSDKEILQEQAQRLITIDEHVTGAASSVSASFAKGLIDHMGPIGLEIQKLGTFLKDKVEPVGRKVGETIDKVLSWLDGHGSEFAKIAEGVFSISTWLLGYATRHWGLTLAAIAAWKLGGKQYFKGLSGKVGNKINSKISDDSWLKTSSSFRLWRDSSSKSTSLGRSWDAFKNGLTKSQKVAMVGAGVANVGLSVAQGVMAQSAYKDKLNEIQNNTDMTEQQKAEAMAEARTERNSDMGGAIGGGIGGTIGLIFGGPMGAMIGNMIGEFIGGFIGEHWDDIVGAFSAAGEWISEKWGALTDYMGETWDSISEWEIWGDISNMASGAVDWIKDTWNTWVAEPLGRVSKLIQDGWNVLMTAWDNFSFSELGDRALEFVRNAWNENVAQPVMTIYNTINDAWNTYVTQPFRRVIDHIQEVWDNTIGRIQRFISDPIGSTREMASSAAENVTKTARNVWSNVVNFVGGFSEGGIVGGSSYEGDKAVARVNSGEMILNMDQQKDLFKFINNAMSTITKTNVVGNVTHYAATGANTLFNTSNIDKVMDVLSTMMSPRKAMENLTTGTQLLSRVFNSTSNIITTALNPFGGVSTKPFGENTFKKIPTNVSVDRNGNTEVKVNDININLSGTIKLDAGSSSTSIDVNKLLSDHSFMSSLKDILKQAINEDINGGRVISDASTMRNLVASTSSIGKR